MIFTFCLFALMAYCIWFGYFLNKPSRGGLIGALEDLKKLVHAILILSFGFFVVYQAYKGVASC